MSGAEVIAVLGVISSVIAIVDGTKQVYDAASNTHGLPEAFREVADRLPVVRHILELAKTDIETGDGDEKVRKEVKNLVNTCGDKAKKLNELFRKVIPSESASRTKRYYSAVKTLGKGSQVEFLMKGMLEDVQLLTSNRTMNAMTTAQAEQIVKAISELSALQSSVPENIFEETGFTANNSGPGTQTNYHARGEYIAQGSAKQYNSAGGTMNFAETINNIYNQNSRDLNADNQNQNELLAALFLTDPKDDRSSMIYTKGQRASGTCEWIKTNHLYLSWLSSDSQLLWISGGPGKGKTMLSIFLAEEFEKMGKAPNFFFLQYFCDNKDAKRNTSITILRGFLYQLLKAAPSLFEHVLPEFKNQKEAIITSFETLWRFFAAMIRDTVLGEIYCVLDGIDECDGASADLLLKKFREIFSKKMGNTPRVHIKVVILSRDLPDFIPESLSSFPRIRLDPDSDIEVNNDIARFIDIKVDELSILKNYGSLLTGYVKEEFRKRAQSTFLWVGIVAMELEKYKASEAEKALQLFPSGLEALYARMLLQIVPYKRQITAKILRWVVLAIRPFTLSELAIALRGTLEPSSFSSPREIIQDKVLSCGCFLSINSDIIELVHQSAKDYLLRAVSDFSPELEIFRVDKYSGNLELAEECLRYLENYYLQHMKLDCQGYARPPRENLFEYAKYWFVHAKSLSSMEGIFDLSRPFYKKQGIWLSWDINLHPSFPEETCSQTLLHIASRNDILPLVERLLSWKQWAKNPFFVNKRDLHGNTALHTATAEGNTATMLLLLAKGATVNAKNNSGTTAMGIAAGCGNMDMIRMLVNHGGDINAKNADTTPPLFEAVENYEIGTIQLLLELGADLHAKSYNGVTALIKACERGYWKLKSSIFFMEQYSYEDEDIKSKTASDEKLYDYTTADMVEILLKRGANVEARRKDDGWTALIIAAERGHFSVVKLLLENCADVEAKDKKGQTAIQIASNSTSEKSFEVVQLLSDHGARDTRPKPHQRIIYE